MTDRYDELAIPPDPSRAEALRRALHAHLLDPTSTHLTAPTVTPTSGDDGESPLSSYPPGSGEPPQRRNRSWLKIAAVAAALILVVPAAIALLRLAHKNDRVNVGPAATTTTEPPRDPAVIATINLMSTPTEVKAFGDAVWVVGPTSCRLKPPGPACRTGGDTVSRIDTATNKVVATIAIDAQNVSLDATNDAVWVGGSTPGGKPFVSRIDPTTNKVVATIDVSPTATQIMDVAATNNAVWLATWNAVVRIDPTSNKVVDTIPARGASLVTATRDAIWVFSAVTSSPSNVPHGQLTRIDPATNRIVATIPTGIVAAQIAASDDAVWIADTTKPTLLRVDPRTNQIVATLAIPAIVGGLALDQIGVVRATMADNKLYRIDPATNQITLTVGLDFGLKASVSVTPDAIWISSEYGNAVTRVDPGTH